MKFLRLALKTFRLSLLRFGAGWMFALLTLNFNRIAVYELGAVAVIVTTLIGLHHFISPFQVFFGRLSDRYSILGYRRGPLILGSALVAGLVFTTLPTLAIHLGAGSLVAIVSAFVLLTVFGLAIAANGAANNALVADTTDDRERGIVVAVVWTFIILSSIISAQVAKTIMPVYDPQQMQFLYNLTPLIVMGTTLLGWIGIEKRVAQSDLSVVPSHADAVASTQQHAFRVAWELLRTNRQTRSFFMFVLLAILGIFLQDAILEIFGGEVFNLTPGETATFQQSWGSGVLLGMFVVGLLSWRLPASKKTLAMTGGIGIALGLMLLAGSAATLQRTLINPALGIMGLGTGVFNVGALSMMMEMTVDGNVGLFMGLWGVAQGLGTGLANVLSGVLHTTLIDSQLLTPSAAYTLIFGLEAFVMIIAIGVLRGISVESFKGLNRTDIQTAMAFDTAM